MFFNTISTPGLGKKDNLLTQSEATYGQANLSINANPINGNLVIENFTQPFFEQSFNFNLGYQYNSQSKAAWRLNQGKTIGTIQGGLNEECSYVKVEEADGHLSTYTYDSTRECYVNLSETDGSSTLTYSEGQWIGWNPSSNVKEYYNENNQLKECKDSSGNYLSYQYDAQGRLVSISGASGHKIVIEYLENTTAIYSEIGNTKNLLSKNLFDDKNQLTKTIIPVNDGENYEIDYGYYDSGLLKNIHQSDSTKVSFEYEMKNNPPLLKKLTDGVDNCYTLQYEKDTTHLIDPLNHKETFTLNNHGLLKEHTQHNQTTIYGYDKLLRIQSIEYPDNSSSEFCYDELGFISELVGRCKESTHFSHDIKTGLLLCETQLSNGIEHNTFYVYNEKQELVFKILPNGCVHQFSYNEKGLCIEQKIYLENTLELNHHNKNEPLSQAAVENWCAQQNPKLIALTKWTHNEYGQKSSETCFTTIDEYGQGIIDEGTSVKEFEWTIHGDLLTQKTRLNPQESAVKSTQFDGLSRPVKEINPEGQVTTHNYSANQHQTTLPSGLVTTTTCNAGGQLVNTKEQSGEDTKNSTLTYDKLGRVCIIEKGAKDYSIYDDANRSIYHIDPLGRVTKSIYDCNHKLIHLCRYKNPITNIAENAIINGTWSPELFGEYCIESNFYDGNGKLLGSINGDNFVTKHVYDGFGNLIKTIEYADALNISEQKREALENLPKMEKSEEDRTHQFYFNKANHLIGEQNAHGQLIAYERDAKGQLLTKTTTLGAQPWIKSWDKNLVLSVPNKREHFTLDALGQCKEETNAEGIATAKTWDACGRLTRKTCGDHSEDCTWDAMNRLNTQTLSSGLQTSTSYAACGKISTETKIDLLDTSKPRSKLFRYNGFGQITHELSPRMALKLREAELAKDDSLIETIWREKSKKHFYDQRGLKTCIEDELGNCSYFYYNAADELCFTISPTGSITEYTYDFLAQQRNSSRFYATCLNEGELASLKGGLLSDALTRSFESKKSDNDAVITLEFNNRGLAELMIDEEGYKTRYGYDAFNNIVRIEQQIDEENSLVCQMKYDKKDRPLEKIKDVEGINATETWKYTDEKNLTEYTDPNSNTSQTYKDKLGRKTCKINPLGNEEHLEWDELSRLKSKTDALGIETTLKYKNNGRTIVTTCEGKESILEKNAFGEIELEQNEDGEVTQKKP